MSHAPDKLDLEAIGTLDDPSVSHIVHHVVQFLRVVRSRINILIIAIVVSSLLGGLYYATATRYFQANASVLIIRNGGSEGSSSMGIDGENRRYMPTHEQLLKSAVVLSGVRQLVEPSHQVDFQGTRGPGVGVLASNISVSTAKGTNIIHVRYQSKDPDAAEAVLNSLLTSYKNFIKSTHGRTAEDVMEVLQQEKIQLKGEIDRKKERLLEAQRRFGDFTNGGETDHVHPLVERALALHTELTVAETERIKHQAALESIRAAIHSGADLNQFLMSAEQSVGRSVLMTALGINDRDVVGHTNLERTLLQDRATVQGLLENLGPNHPRVKEMTEKIRMTERHLAEYGERIRAQVGTLQSTTFGPTLTHMMEQALASAWHRENQLRAAFAEAKEDAVRLNRDLHEIQFLEREIGQLSNLYGALADRIASVDLAKDQGDIRSEIIKEPAASRVPVSPRLKTVAAACLFSGLVIGGVVIFVLDTLDDRFRSPEDVTMRLGAPTLAMVAQLDMTHQTGVEAVHTHVDPNSPECEAFRTLRTALSFNPEETQRLVVSSAEPGDGKTTVLSNLGTSIAQSGKKVLMIDADLRRPGLTALFALKREHGLSDVLNAPEPVEEVATRYVRGTGIPDLDVLPSGPRRPNPAELLTSRRLADLLAWAETHYDQILVDSPPVLAASDVMVIGRIVDGLVLVINPAKNRRRLVTRAYESLRTMGVTVLGIVANRIDQDQSKGYGYGYGYTYSYNYGGSDEETHHVEEPLPHAESPELAAPGSVSFELDSTAPWPPQTQQQVVHDGTTVPRKVA
ncbi:MAG: hypothetical protein DWQ31_21350 [Planctomycetota bacterium]|nr:MAG: hypothetical protein DWQ31_21350 [Planctomycetota bacterium]REJ93652.1 MAG: hypothetical protein DWQ35_09885 [Planctomycetota bacterium]REK25701.1 MAG: hypothetical protein DWQ42_10625 [Planctomycetota bacterium]REK46553.1 MAG: hypothetical protein DWQ46_06680 [Planctomycetota bacterium]